MKRKSRCTSTCFSDLVAGVGLEPHDLRVMSPTSYQLLYPAIYIRSLERLNIILRTRAFVKYFFHISKISLKYSNIIAVNGRIIYICTESEKRIDCSWIIL